MQNMTADIIINGAAKITSYIFLWIYFGMHIDSPMIMAASIWSKYFPSDKIYIHIHDLKLPGYTYMT